MAGPESLAEGSISLPGSTQRFDLEGITIATTVIFQAAGKDLIILQSQSVFASFSAHSKLRLKYARRVLTRLLRSDSYAVLDFPEEC